MPDLTSGQIEELEAIQLTTTTLGHAASLWYKLWSDPVIGPLARRRLITWRRGYPAWGPDFRAVELTIKGREALIAAKGADDGR